MIRTVALGGATVSFRTESPGVDFRMRFIHAADLHLDSPMAGSRSRLHGTVGDISGATRTAFRRMIDLAVTEKVDLVLLAGDVFDRDWPDYTTGLFFLGGLADLERAGIRVAMVRGNHDAANRMSRSLTWPGNVHEFDSRRPSTQLLPDLGVAIHGQSFADGAVTENLAAAYPGPNAGWFNIGLLHTSADGTFGHDTYAPCAISDLVGKGYDYWALGHVHQRRVISEEPYIVFPGNLQGRHVNEPGEKGFALVTVEAGKVQALAFPPVDTVRWTDLRVDVARAATLDEVLPLVAEAFAKATGKADERMVAARLRLVGATLAHGELIADRERLEAECDGLAEQCPGTVLIERIVIETTPFTGSGTASRAGAVDLAPFVGAICDDRVEAAELRLALEDALGRLPPNLRSHPDLDLAMLGDDRFASLLSDARAVLAHRLGSGDRRR